MAADRNAEFEVEATTTRHSRTNTPIYVGGCMTSETASEEHKAHTKSRIAPGGAQITDGLQEVPEELQKLEKDSFSFIGVVSLAVSCINSWVVLVTALGAGLTSGGPTASK